MVNLRGEAVDQDLLLRFLEEKSDFHFELRVLRMLRELALQCEHGGHYEDPATKKSREFDIRCRAVAGPLRVQLAVECKNLQANFPLLVTAVPRRLEEAWHEIALIEDQPKRSLEMDAEGLRRLGPRRRTSVFRLRGQRSMWREGEPVGKSTAQVGLKAQPASGRGADELVTNDSEVYEKWGQCLSSLHDLATEIEGMGCETGRPGSRSPVLATLLPVLVVPDGMLWRTLYAENGERVEDPRQVDRVSLLAGKEYDTSDSTRTALSLAVSHLEIMTAGGIEAFARECLTSQEAMQQAFFAGDDLGAALDEESARLMEQMQ